jgi:hypothetical protein
VSKKKQVARPDDELFDSADPFGAAADPFAEPEDPIGDIEYPGTADGDLAATLGAVSNAFRERARAEAARFEAATDSEYWCALVFETRAQKEAFLAALGWLARGDKYLDGVALAKRNGIPLPPAHVPYRASKGDKKLDAISLPLPGA